MCVDFVTSALLFLLLPNITHTYSPSKVEADFPVCPRSEIFDLKY